MRSPRTALLALALVGTGTLAVLLLGAFITPQRPITHSEVDFGRVEALALGSVTTYRLFEDSTGPERLSSGDALLQGCHPRYAGVVVHIVRLADGTFHALDAHSPHMGELTPWRPDFQWEGERGWFREPCHGDTYAIDGKRVYGPAPRDLDYYDVRIEDGRVLVDLGDLHRGYRPPRQDPGTPPPTSTATPR